MLMIPMFIGCDDIETWNAPLSKLRADRQSLNTALTSSFVNLQDEKHNKGLSTYYVSQFWWLPGFGFL